MNIRTTEGATHLLERWKPLLTPSSGLWRRPYILRERGYYIYAAGKDPKLDRTG